MTGQTNPFQKTKDLAYRALKDKIIEEALDAERRINISRVAEELNISRTPVRDALDILREEGFVIRKEGKSGLFPITVTKEQIEDLFFARTMIEGYATYLCAKHNMELDMDRFKELAEAFHHCFKKGNFTKFDQIDMDFHRLIVESCGNRYFIEMYHSLNNVIPLVDAKIRNLLRKGPVMKAVSGISLQHLNIVYAIRMGIPTLAMQASNSHLDSCLDLIRRFYHEY